MLITHIPIDWRNTTQNLLTTGTISALSGTFSGLTPTHVIFAGTAGLLSGSANLTFTNNATATLSEILCAGNLSAGAFLKIPDTTSTVGQLLQNGLCVFHTFYPKNQATSNRNIFIGERAGNFTMNNSVNSQDGTQNVGIGTGALYSLTTGIFNMAIGANSGNAITSGGSNVLIGPGSGIAITTGTGNMLFGRNAGVALKTGEYNCAIGAYALTACVSASYNTCVGRDALAATTGSGNVGIGYSAGSSNVSGTYSIYIGYRAGRYATAGNLLIIDNQSRTDAATEVTSCMLYGVFNATVANQTLRMNGMFGINKTPTVALDVTGAGLFSLTLGVTGLSTLTGGISLPAGADIALATTTGTKIGTATNQLLGFYNATPVVQQTGIAAQKTDYTAGDLDTEAEIITALNTTNTAINALRTALNNLGLTSIV